jgi:hypothetical protein
MSFMDILWAIVSVFLALCMAACVIAFAVLVTWFDVTEGAQHENAKR